MIQSLLAQSFLVDFFYTFIPIFVAMDVGGLVPIFLNLTKELTAEQRRLVSLQALFTAFLISVLFIAVGRLVFHVIGISVADFEIAGGLLLLVLAVIEMLQGENKRLTGGIHAGPVPLGTPLIAGPAVLTSLIILVSLRGYFVTFTALVANLVIVSIAFQQSRWIARVIGEHGLRASSQVISLFLAAIAVSMIRRGFEAITTG
jgi:multiple antibiotic resistance protein